jgi:sec-independent protein translocase protein TatC
VQLELKPVTLAGQQVFVWGPVTNSGALPVQKLDLPIINLGPASAFIVAFKVAIYAGIVLAAPFIFYYVGCFVFPALKLREKKYVYRGLGFAVGLFFLGVSFCYFVLAPVALSASVQYSQWLGFGVTQWRAEEYIGFLCKFMLGMGLGFELPVVVLTLVKIGILSYRILSKARRYVIVINFVLGAVLTTPEVITQVLMALPLQILYEISVWIAWYWERQERKLKEAEEAQARA